MIPERAKMKELRDYQVADLSFYMRTPRCLNTSDPGSKHQGTPPLFRSDLTCHL